MSMLQTAINEAIANDAIKIDSSTEETRAYLCTNPDDHHEVFIHIGDRFPSGWFAVYLGDLSQPARRPHHHRSNNRRISQRITGLTEVC